MMNVEVKLEVEKFLCSLRYSSFNCSSVRHSKGSLN